MDFFWEWIKKQLVVISILNRKHTFEEMSFSHFELVFFILIFSRKGALSKLGVTFGILASLFVALNSIYIKKVLNVVQGDVSLLTYYNNINASLLFPPLMLLFGERHNIIQFEHYGSLWFWGPMILGGIFGFAIGYLTSLQVKVTETWRTTLFETNYTILM